MSIVNITATFAIEPQDLAVISKRPELWRQRKRVKRVRQTSAFKCAVLQKPESAIVFLVFKTGKCVCLAARSSAAVADACLWLANTLSSPITSHPSIRNIVYCFSLRDSAGNQLAVDIESLFAQLYSVWLTIAAKARRHFGNFDPELSPSFIYIPKVHKGTKALIFRSGKVNLTGLKTESQTAALVQEIQNLLETKCQSQLLSIQ